MALSALDDLSRRPDPAQLRKVLGPSRSLWSDLILQATALCSDLVQEWNFAGPRYGWSLRLKREGRIVLHLTPRPSHFLVGIVLGAKAVTAARAGGLPEAALAILEAAPKYAEGTGIRMPVASVADLRVARRFLGMKISGANQSVRSGTRRRAPRPS